jgi:hypothetical protein
MTTAFDTSYAFGKYPMLVEIRPGLIYQEPLTYYNLVGDDAPIINSAFTYLQNKYGGGTVWLAPMGFVLQSTVNVPWMCHFKGSGWPTVLNYSGNTNAVIISDPTLSQPPVGSRHQISGSVADMVIDGTNAGPNAILLASVDIHSGLYLNAVVQNATGINAVGYLCANFLLAHNYTRGSVAAANCTTGHLFTVLPGGNNETAIEHINLDLNASMLTGQNGIHLTNSVGMQSCRMTVTLASEASNAGAGCVMDAGTTWQSCDFLWKHEMAPNPGTSQTFQFTSSTAKFSQCTGIIWTGPNLQPATGIAVPNLNNQFVFGGLVFGDNVLQAAQSMAGNMDKTGVTMSVPAVPPSGTAVRNPNGTAGWVTFNGATLTAATLVTGAPLGYSANVASPCVFTVFGSNFAAQQQVMLTQGTAPGGFSNGIVYYVATSPAPTANTFSLSASPTGSPAINSSSTGSGTQNVAPLFTIGDTATRTFLVPAAGMIVPTYTALAGWTWQPIG